MLEKGKDELSQPYWVWICNFCIQKTIRNYLQELQTSGKAV